MTTSAPTTPDALETETSERNWGLVLGGGIALVLISMFMFAFPAATSVAITMILGWVIFAAGVVGIFTGFAHRKDGGLWISLILGVLAVIAGLLLAFRPLSGTVTLATLFVIWLIADGLIGTIASLVQRGPDWGWWLASSLISLVLGIVLFGTLPVGSFWVLGTFAAITLLFRGLIMIVVSFEIRRRAQTA